MASSAKSLPLDFMIIRSDLLDRAQVPIYLGNDGAHIGFGGQAFDHEARTKAPSAVFKDILPIAGWHIVASLKFRVRAHPIPTMAARKIVVPRSAFKQTLDQPIENTSIRAMFRANFIRGEKHRAIWRARK
jgi:hypothetical protein